MADILPPAPVEAPFGSYNWTDWYKKVRDAINNAGVVNWVAIVGTPTTLAGYGITDAQRGLQFKDEGFNLGGSGSVTSVDFTGAGVTASRVGDAVTVAISSGGGSSIAGTTSITVPPNRYEYSQAVTVLGVTSLDSILVSLSNHSDTDENSEEMIDIVSMAGIPATDQITFTLTFSEPTAGVIKLNYMVV